MTFCSCLFLTWPTYGQVPQTYSYQPTIGTNGDLVATFTDTYSDNETLCPRTVLPNGGQYYSAETTLNGVNGDGLYEPNEVEIFNYALPLIRNSDGTWQEATLTDDGVAFGGLSNVYPFGIGGPGQGPGSSGGTVQTNKLTRMSHLSKAGILTTYLTYKFSQVGAAANPSPGLSITPSVSTASEKETIDLNTGKYIADSQGSTAGVEYCQYADGTFYTISDHEATTHHVTGNIDFSATAANASSSSLSVVNPAAMGSFLPLSQNIPADVLQTAPPALALAADGASAIAVLYASDSDGPVTFTLTSQSGIVGDVGGLAAYSPTYLVSPPTSSASSYTAQQPINESQCAPSDGSTPTAECMFVALLTAPLMMPTVTTTTDMLDSVELSIQALQQGSQNASSVSVQLLPPPLVLVHGIWSNANTWSDLQEWLRTNYPHGFIFSVDYSSTNSLAFTNPGTQQALTATVADALQTATNDGLAAQKVDIVAHSMGGLVSRYFIDAGAPAPYSSNFLPAAPIHSLITIGTPQDGSPFATFLDKHQSDKPTVVPPPFNLLCNATSICNLGSVLTYLGKPVGSGVTSLEAGLSSSSYPYSSIVGQSADPSVTGLILNALLSAFSPGNTVNGILGTPNDTIVPGPNQNRGAADSATIEGVVHTSLTGNLFDTGETVSEPIWTQAAYWLLGQGTGGDASSSSVHSRLKMNIKNAQAQNEASANPIFDLTGYTQVPSSNVTFAPASGSALNIGDPTTTINATTSGSKTIIEILLFQNVEDPSDSAVLYTTQAPFGITFTPARLGSAEFTAVAVFADKTFATQPLNYILQLTGAPVRLSIQAPSSPLPIGLSRTIQAKADFINGSVDVTRQVKYAARSGGTSVFSVGSNGSILATGNGYDWLDASYLGQNASAIISVGSCTYSLEAPSEIVPQSGGSISIQVLTQGGCFWSADAGGSNWVDLSGATGEGSGTISANVGTNATGLQRKAFINVAGQDVAIIQVADACSYSLGATAIQAPAAGASGSISVATVCQVVAGSSQPWVTTTARSSAVDYHIAANITTRTRNAIITIGDQDVQVTQAGSVPSPTVTVTPSSSSITTAQELSVTVVVSGNSSGGTPTGSVILSSGGYSSAATPLNGGAALINIPPGSLGSGKDTLNVKYLPDAGSPYNTAIGEAVVSVSDSVKTMPTVTVTPAMSSITTAQALSVVVAVRGNNGKTPTGTVVLTSGGYTSAAVILAGGSAEISVPVGSLTLGNDILSVEYTPDLASFPLYEPASGAVTVVVSAQPKATFSINATAVTATPGGTAESTVTLGSTNGFVGIVTLTCEIASSPYGAVDQPTCNSGQKVTFTSGTTSGTATIMVDTTAPSISKSRPNKGGRAIDSTVLALVLAFGIPARRRIWQSIAVVLIGLTIFSGLTACGGQREDNSSPPTKNAGTSAGVYTFKIIGTGNDSANTTNTTSFTLTVN